jgi:hypothetical protein
MEYEGWTVEATHALEGDDACDTCRRAVERAHHYATSEESSAHGHTIVDHDGISHTGIVRLVEEPGPVEGE